MEARLSEVKMLLGITDSSSDGLLSFLIVDAMRLIKGYCRIYELPEELNSVCSMIAADMYRAKGYGSEDAPEDVKSVTEGARSVAIESHRPDGEEILRNYYKRLRPYINRRGRVPSEV